MKHIQIIGAFPGHGEAGKPSWHILALVEGLKAIGVKTIISPLGMPGIKHVAGWGWKRGAQYRRMGKNFLVLERGYIGDRFIYTSVGWNGLNGHATFPEYPDDGGARFRAHGGELRPWKKTGDYILILGQVRNDASLKGQDISQWYNDRAREAAAIYGLPVYFRPHPEARRRGGYNTIDGAPNMKDCPLAEAIDGALFTIAYNSNSCLDSVLRGVPCFAGDKGTMAYSLCMDNIDEIITPDREPVVNKIAFTQWHPDEIRSGEALRKIIECAPLL